MTPRLTRTTAGLAVGITFAVALACGAGAYLYSLHHFQALLEMTRTSAITEGELIREALEHQMIENDRSLIAGMVQSFGRQPRVANIMVLDRHGVLRYSSAAAPAPADLRLASPTCQACHQFAPEHRGSSRVIEAGGGSILRTVIPVRNREACHRCHDASHRINGILIVDRDVGELRAEMTRDLWWMTGGSGALALVLTVLIALVVRVVILRRLQRFETTARLIAAGDLARRVPMEGSDTISWLAREFNTMADAVTGLLSEVGSQRERLETVINSIDDGIVVLDASRHVVAANDAFLRRTRRSRQDVLGFCCRGDVAGACQVDDCPTLACLQSGEGQVRICERAAPDGTPAWEEVHASPIRSASGSVAQVVEVWRDISARRAAEARMAESHRLASLGLLASGFSHELNTPLGTVLACVEGILRDLPGDGDRPAPWDAIRERAAIAREQVLRCRGVTGQFLRLSRGQAAAVDIVDVHDAVVAVARLIDPTARAHAVVIDVDQVVPGPRVRADEGELQQALVNLLLNAVQASPTGGRVTVVTTGGERVRIRITDQGCGLAVEHQTRIFEPFFSLRQGGTGLGLFLALNAVRSWGGDIAVDSAPGRGATFEIVLPAPPETDEEAR